MVTFENGEVLKGPHDAEDIFFWVVGGYLILVAMICAALHLT